MAFLRSIINFKDALHLVVGVNIRLLIEGGTDISYCVLKRDGDHVTLIDKKNGLISVDDLLTCLEAYVTKEIRIHVNCIGRSILDKKVNGRTQEIQSALQEWFPGIRSEDFIFQRFCKSEFTIFSVMRNDDVFKGNFFLNSRITSFSLGIYIIETLGSLIHDEAVVIDGMRIAFEGGQIKSIAHCEQEQRSVTIGDEVVQGPYILAYASAMMFFLPIHDLVSEGLPSEILDSTRRYAAKKQIYAACKKLIIALFLLLSINFAINFWLTDSVANMESKLQFHQGWKSSHQQNRKTTQKISIAYNALGYKDNRLPLYYSDQVCGTVPSNIVLKKIEAGLLNENILRKDRQYHFDVTQIKIEGFSQDPLVVNNWISVLSQMHWVSSVRGQKYSFDTGLGKGVFEFIIFIKQ
jgi:hypothetical protein